jgi:hypothetical protein
MNAIRIRVRLDSDTPHLPELKSLIGKTVEFLVREEAPIISEKNAYDEFMELAGQDLVDPEAYKRLRSTS